MSHRVYTSEFEDEALRQVVELPKRFLRLDPHPDERQGQ